MGKLAKNYFYNLIYQIFVTIVPIVTAPYVSRVLSAHEIGIYSYVSSVVTLMTSVLLLGVYNYGSRQIAYVRDNDLKMASVFSQIMSLRLVMLIISTVIYIAVIFIIGKYRIFFNIYYIYLLAFFIDSAWLFIGVEDMKWFVIKNVITKLFIIIGIITLVKNKNDLAIYTLVQALAFFISNILVYPQLKRYILNFKFDFSNLIQDFKGSLYLFLPSIATEIYLQAGKIFLSIFGKNTSQIAIYDYSEKIVTIPLAVITVLSTVMMPRIANEFKKKNMKRISDLINSAISFSVFLAYPLMFGLSVIANKLIPWYLGSSFHDSASIIVVLSPVVLSNALLGISGGQYFTALNKIKILIISQFLILVTDILLNVALVPSFGFYGTAISTVVSSFLGAIVQYIYLSKEIRLRNLFSENLKYLIIGVSMYSIIYFVTNRLVASPVTNLIQILIGIVVYFSICLITKDRNMHIILKKLGIGWT